MDKIIFTSFLEFAGGRANILTLTPRKVCPVELITSGNFANNSHFDQLFKTNSEKL